jgi:hypothetical protein
MPSPKLRRTVPLTTALALWDIWRRLPPSQRRWLASQAKTHGPRLAKQAIASSRRSKRL